MVDLEIGRNKDKDPDHDMSQAEDTEITLSTGRLLGIFFVLVFICSGFFTLGYLVGRANAAGGKTEIVGAAPTGGSPAGKPSAVDKTPAGQTTAGGNTAIPPLTPTPSSTPSALPSPQPTPGPDMKPTGSGTYTVQVAAVSKREDAESLVSVLSKKQYPVFISNFPGDPLFHVQVGPFSDPKDAETMRSRLAAEGYDAIVKR